jgi:hypothetical protein
MVIFFTVFSLENPYRITGGMTVREVQVRLCVLILPVLLVSCATPAQQPPQTWIYKGHCVKAQIGGKDLLADCGDSVAVLEFPSGVSAIVFPLSADRKLMFISPSDPKIHQVNASWFQSKTTLSVLRLSMSSGAGEYVYDRVVVGCDRTQEVPVPKFVECIGQADGQPVFFGFETDGTPPVADKSQAQ